MDLATYFTRCICAIVPTVAPEPHAHGDATMMNADEVRCHADN